MVSASFKDICMSRLQTLGSITCDQYGSKRWKATTNCLDWSRGLGLPKQPIGRLESHAAHGPLECVPSICVPQRYYKGGASSAGEHGKGQQQAHLGHLKCYLKKQQQKKTILNAPAGKEESCSPWQEGRCCPLEREPAVCPLSYHRQTFSSGHLQGP